MNAVENVAGIVLAWKGKSDLAISVVKNSVVQIAVVLFPVLVLASLFFATPLTFVLSPVFIGALVLTALAVWQVTTDGEAVAFLADPDRSGFVNGTALSVDGGWHADGSWPSLRLGARSRS